MKSKLEYFIEEHREELDSEMPSHDIWKRIEQKRMKKNVSMMDSFSVRQIAASFLLLLSGIAIIVLFETSHVRDKGSPSASMVKQAPVEDADNLYQNDIHQMNHIIEIKQSELKQIEKSDPELYKNFTKALGQLNAYYNKLAEELNNNPNKEQLLKAMIQNLKLQQELLNEQLSIFQNIKQSKNEQYHKNI